MARTRIVIEVESDDSKFVYAAGAVIVENCRILLKAFQREIPAAEVTTNITHDGKDVTEVIQ